MSSDSTEVPKRIRRLRRQEEIDLGMLSLEGEVSKKTKIFNGVPTNSLSIHLDNIRPFDLEDVLNIIRKEMDSVIKDDQESAEFMKFNLRH